MRYGSVQATLTIRRDKRFSRDCVPEKFASSLCRRHVSFSSDLEEVFEFVRDGKRKGQLKSVHKYFGKKSAKKRASGTHTQH